MVGNNAMHIAGAKAVAELDMWQSRLSRGPYAELGTLVYEDVWLKGHVALH